MTAKLLASVPPPVKMISMGLAPKAATINSLLSSTTLRAILPEACKEEGLPTWANSAFIAAIDSTNMGVVAAWSK